MNVLDQIQQLIKERDYYKSLCQKHKIMDTLEQTRKYVRLSEIIGYFNRINYLALSNDWMKTCKRVWASLIKDLPETMTFDELRRKHVSEYILNLDNSKSTRISYLSSIRNVVKVITEYYGEEIIIPETDPTLGVHVRLTDEEKTMMEVRKEKSLDIDDFHTWQNHPFTGREEYLRNLSLFQCFTGLAARELSDFKPEVHIVKVMSGEKKIRIQRSKSKNSTGAYSEIPLFPETESLIGYFESNQGIYGTKKQRKHFLSVPSSYYAWLQKLSLKAELNTQMTPHGGRHTFANLMLMKGFSVYAISLMMGHSSVTVTEKNYIDKNFGYIEKEYKELKNKAY